MFLVAANVYIPALILLGAVAILALLLIVPRKLARRSKILPDPVQTRMQERELEDVVEGLLVKLHEIDREVHAKIDTKLAGLNVLVAEADRKISELRLVLGKFETARGIPAGSARATEPRPISPDDADTPARQERHTQIYELSDAGEDILSISRKSGIPRGEVELILQLRAR